MFPTLYMLTLLAQFTESPKPLTVDRAEVVQSGDQGQLSWSDAEDKVTGSFSPFAVEAGKPIDLVVRVGNLQGPPFDGPVTLTLKAQSEMGPGDTKTVKMMAGPKAWSAQLLTRDPGPYWLEIAFATTRHKVVRAEVNVVEPRLPRWPWWVMAGVAGAIALALGVRAAIGKKT